MSRVSTRTSVRAGATRGATISVAVMALAALACLAAPPAARAEESAEERLRALEEKVRRLEDADRESRKNLPENLFDVYWQDGPRFETIDGTFRFDLNGRAIIDMAWISEDDGTREVVGKQEDGVEARQIRIGFEGFVFTHIEYQLEVDLAEDENELKTTFLGVRDVVPGIDSIRAGFVKQPFGLEQELTDLRATFMENGLPDALVPQRAVGMRVQGTLFDERFNYAFGAFKEADNRAFAQEDGKAAASVRLTCLPYVADDRTTLLHVGGSYHIRGVPGDEIRLRSRPEVHLADRYVDTGDIAADITHTFGAETYLMVGPFSMQAEAVAMRIQTEDAAGGDPLVYGAYALVSFVVTGESRTYNEKNAEPGLVRPARPFLHEGGLGALEVAARVSYLDLQDDGALEDVPRLMDVTFGVNWYLHANARVSSNYVFADLEDAGDTHTLMLRVQVDF